MRTTLLSRESSVYHRASLGIVDTTHALPPLCVSLSFLRFAAIKYRTTLVDPPWPQKTVGRYSRRRHSRPDRLPYMTMNLVDIKALPVGDFADVGCHLWLWTTNAFLRDGFDVMEAWGFRYLAPVTWVKPSGLGAWFAHATQTLLMGYKGRCIFNGARYKPTAFRANPKAHSTKPDEAYRLIESISDAPRLELFARAKRDGWQVWGDEVECDIAMVSRAS
jgi:N6-adenosine-specific RNA methylase IME4